MDNIEEFYVINRKGESVQLDFNKILLRLTKLKEFKPVLHVNVGLIAQNTIKLMANHITTIELDNISANFCASMMTTHPDYGVLASRIEVSNLHKETSADYYKTVLDINNYIINGENVEILDTKLVAFVKYYNSEINRIIDYKKDYDFSYFGIKTLMKAYLLKHIEGKHNKILERPQQMFLRVAIGINLNNINEDGTTSKETLNEIFETYEVLSQQLYTHATPTLFNAGTKRQSLSSCFLLEVPDNLEGIYKTLADTSRISKWSGGIGIEVTQVRAKDSIIKSTNGKSEGIIPMLKVYNDSALYVSQGGGRRKGSTAVYIQPWHADIEGFLDLKKPIGDEMLRARDLFLALWVPDLFMKRLEIAIKTNTNIMWSLFCPNKAKGLSDTYGDEFEDLYVKYENEKKYNKQVNIVTLWKHILEIQMESGVPYIMFKDSVNRKNNQNNLGMIRSSNLCVHGDTLILTKEGYYPIKDLANKNVEIWNGSEFSLSPVKKTGENQKLLKITTKDGCELKCTKYHKFHIVCGSRNRSQTIIEAGSLTINDRLIKFNLPSIDGDMKNDFIYPYTHGFFCADGSYLHKNSKGDKCYPVNMLYGCKKELLQYMNYEGNIYENSKRDYLRVKLVNNINKKYDVPINASLKNKLLWLAGYLDGDGCISKSKYTSYIVAVSINKEFLHKIKLMCNTLGCNPILSKCKDEINSLFPAHKEGSEKKLYNCKKVYRLRFNATDVHYLYKDLNIPTKRLNYDNMGPVRNTHQYLQISSIEEVEGFHDTYCFNEPKNHTGIFNGILTGNCAEINIYTDKDNIGVCNLASVCLPKFVEENNNGVISYNYQKLYETVRIATKNLNKVIDSNIYPVKEGKYSDSQNRPIAIGVQGLADVFFKFKIPFTSDKAKEINKLIAETIYYAAATESNNIATKLGKSYKTFSTSMASRGVLQPDLWEVTPSNLWDWEFLKQKIIHNGLYNSLLIALMPTASSSQIMGNFESFEPQQSNMFLRSTLSGSFQIINKYLVNDLIKLNLWNDNMKQKIIAYNGSIQEILEIPDNIKEVYKTIWEIKQRDLIDMDRDRSVYVCHSSSSNRYMKDPTTNKLTSMHMYSWKQGLKTGMYYLRSSSSVGAVKFNVSVDILKDIDNKKNKQENDDCLVCSA
jgi:ribonucleoside-diphosphate reductase alpha chain